MATDRLAKRPFGSGRLMTPPIAVGCAPMGSMTEAFGYAVSEEDAVATIATALAGPINFIDTAALYGDGVSETRVGKGLAALGGLPEGAVLQTKQGRNPKDNDYSGDTVKWRMERSLQLLGVDRVDAVYLHDAEWTTFEEAMAPGGPVEVLQKFKDEGVFDYLGVAAGPNEVELQYIETGQFDAVITHNRYTLLNQNANPVIDAAHERGMAVLNAAPYGSGILVRGPESYPRYAYSEAPDAMIERTLVLREICDRYGVPLAAAAVQFSTLDPRIDVTIIGMSHPDRLAQTIEFATIEIPDACWEEINALPALPQDNPEERRYSEKLPYEK
ncbi:MAG: aldo/keto reductase [Thermomicrobiales bacterium]|nr:aldo/keto reductase [Thermomicrobiales bacterium]